MSSQNHSVGIAVTCVDCRLHECSIVPALKQIMGVDKVYIETTAGPEGRILQAEPNHHLLALIDDLELLIKAKGAKVVAIVGHCDCAGHPVSDAQHAIDIVRAAHVVEETLNNSAVRVMALLAQPPAEETTPWGIGPCSPDAVPTDIEVLVTA